MAPTAMIYPSLFLTPTTSSYLKFLKTSISYTPGQNILDPFRAILSTVGLSFK